jgi:MoaA/NifB/PqqE/SkfB family radical SAM enzyme
MNETIMADKETMQHMLNVLPEKSKSISLELTTHCHLKCKYCSRTTEGSGFKAERVPWQTFSKLADNLDEFGRIVVCGMGETFTYKDMYKVTDRLGQKLSFVTSGSIPIDYKKINPKRNIETIMFSIDAPTEEEMLEITGNYNWQNLINNLKRNPYNRSIIMGINCTVFKSNVDRILDVTRFAIKHKMNLINFNNQITDDEDYQFKKKVHQVLAKAEALAKKKKLLFTTSFTDLGCTIFGIPVPFIKVNGDVYPCCRAMDKHKVGNIYEQTFDEMWNSSAYDYFRSGELCFTGCTLFNDIVLEKKYEESKHSPD